MKTLYQKLPIDADSSFVGRIYSSPYFETPWHQHPEYELIMMKEGIGTVFIGNYINDFYEGDIYFIGKNVPHWFRKKDSVEVASSYVIQFNENFLGHGFFDVPEMSSIKNILNESSKGLKISGLLKQNISKRIIEIEKQKGFNKLIFLLLCLKEISNGTANDFDFVDQTEIIQYTDKDKALINKIFEFTMQNYQQKIRLEEVAALTNKSISAFCHFFYKSTKKTYITFLNEIRLAHACKLLTSGSMSITDICFDSGFHNWANFSNHFKNRYGMSPREYRLTYSVGDS